MGMHESCNLGDIFPADVDPQKPALIIAHTPESETVISYGALQAQSHSVARGLARAGCGRGDHIAILAANVTDYLATYLGTMQAGCISVPVNWKLPESALHHVLQDSGAKIIFADAERLALIPADYKVVAFGDDYEAFLDPGPFEPAQMGQNDICMFLYTSGSTGFPKGVPLTHAGHMWVTDVRLKGTANTADHRALVGAPLYHMNALSTAKSLIQKSIIYNNVLPAAA